MNKPKQKYGYWKDKTTYVEIDENGKEHVVNNKETIPEKQIKKREEEVIW